MRKLLLSLFLFSVTVFLFAQSPNQFNYQAVLRNTDGTIMAAEDVSLIVSILKSDLTTSVFEETHTTTTTTQGLININIGSINDLSTIDWTTDNYFIKLSVNGIVMGTSQLLSVPYALHSNTADSVTSTIQETDPVYTAWNKSYYDLIDSPDIIDSINAVIDTTTQFVRTEIDGDVTNEIQNLTSVLAQSNDGGANQIKNISDPTDGQDAATKAYVDAIKESIYDELLDAGLNGIMNDYEGNSYLTIKIGDQVWMAENLNTQYYSDGTEISLVTSNTNWDTLSTDDIARCWWDDDSTTYASTYGSMYTWAAAIRGTTGSTSNPSGIQGVCPSGWHVPSQAEWLELANYLGDLSDAGGKLKEADTTHWNPPNQDATNETGFTALPGGYRYSNGVFYSLGDYGFFISATEVTSSNCRYYHMQYNIGNLIENNYSKEVGYNVRCVKD